MKIPFFSTCCYLLLFLLADCSPPLSKAPVAASPQASRPKPQRPLAISKGKIFMEGDQKMLFGGTDANWHFDISNCSLLDSQFHYGIGRERFHALIEPAYIPLAAADLIYADTARFLLLKIGSTVKAYGIDLLTHHEIVNDVVEGRPIAAAYCILADLGAVYDRKLDDGRTYTFALSGYTYFDSNVWEGMDGFIWWDRETESLWWPLIGESVSGSMKGSKLKVLDQALWSQTTWGKLKQAHPEVLVLKPGQTMEPPQAWPQYEMGSTPVTPSSKTSIAPKWGENKRIKE